MKIKSGVRTGTRFAALLLSFAMMISAATPMCAASSKQMDALDFTENSAPTSGPGWLWDAESKTLKLNGLDMELRTMDTACRAGITVPDGTTVELTKGSSNNIYVEFEYALMDDEITDVIRSMGDLHIVVAGETRGLLNIKAQKGTNAIRSINGDISIDNCTLNIEEINKYDDGDKSPGCAICADADDYANPDYEASITVNNSFIISSGSQTVFKTPKDGGTELIRAFIDASSANSIADTGTKGLKVSACRIVSDSQATKDGQAILTRGPVNVYNSIFRINTSESEAAGIRMLEPSSEAFNNNHFSFDGSACDIDIRGGAGAIIVEDSTTGDKAPVFNFGNLRADTGGELKSVCGTVQGTQTYFWSFASSELKLENGFLTGASTRIYMAMPYDGSALPPSPDNSAKKDKLKNPLKISPKTAVVKYKKLQKVSQTLKVKRIIKFKKSVKDKKAYKLISAKKDKKSFKKYFKINKKTGKLRVKKGLEKGTYRVKVKVRAKGNKKYKASGWKTVTFKVKVK